MNRLLMLLPLAALMITGPACRKKQHDPEQVVQSYFSALEDKNYKQAHGFLSMSSMVMVAPDGQSMRFISKPGFELFQGSYSRYDHIKAQDIKPLPELSQEGKLAVFDVRASIKLTPTSQARIEMFRIFLAPDSSGDWYILTPAPPVVIPDTTAKSEEELN